MRSLTTELKVGLLILAGIGSIVYSSVVVTGWKPGLSDTYTVSIFFDSVSGLLVGSPVQTSGVKVGQVESIALEEGKARVNVAVYSSFPLHADATATIKSIGILGDKYIDVRPGSPSQAKLQSGDSIILTLPGGDLDSLVDNVSLILEDVRSVTASLRSTIGEGAGEERLNAILNQIEKATSDISRITDVTNRQIDTILSNINRFTANLDTITVENRGALKQTLDNFAAFSNDLKAITEQNRDALTRVIANLDTFSAALAKDGPEITGDLRELLSENKQTLNNAINNLDRSFARLDTTMTNLDSITEKMDEGEGTLGKLINDEKTVEELNSALEGINKFLTDADRIKLDIGGHLEYLSNRGDYKSYFDLRLQPLKDRYYLIQLVDNPRGKVSERTVYVTTGGVTTQSKEVVVEDEFQISLLVAQRYFDTVLRGGIMENSFGLGLEQLFGANDQWRLSLDVWDFGNDLGPHVKLLGQWQFFSNAFLVVGGDDLASDNSDLRDTFIGLGLHFNEDSLKPMLSSVPLAN